MQNKFSLIFISLGLAFWFLLAFPFANRNESYSWIVQFEKMNFKEILIDKFPSIKNLRPLGQAIPWAIYKISGKSIYAVQVINFLIVLFAWFILVRASDSKLILCLFFMLIGGLYISSFYYIFNLHGFFYSPLILSIAVLYDFRNHILIIKEFSKVFFLFIIFALIHPFAAIILLSFLLGKLIENRKTISRRTLSIFILVIIIFTLLIKILVPSQGIPVEKENFEGLIKTYENLELGGILSVVSIFFALTQVVLVKNSKERYIYIGCLFLFSFVFFHYSFPLIFLLFIISAIKLMIFDKWSILFLMSASFLFPLIAESGAATKACMLLTIFPVALHLGFKDIEKIIPNIKKEIPIAAFVFMIFLSLSLRIGVKIPIISNVVSPILVAKEKTFQLEKIINWKIHSKEFKKVSMILWGKENKDKSLKLNRKQIPPTSQKYLNEYLEYKGALNTKQTKKELLVCFGDIKFGNGSLLYSVSGEFAGEATVLLDSDN
jgi:hypothetical protein